MIPNNSAASPEDKQTGFLLGLVLFSLFCRLLLVQFKDVVGTDEVIYLALGKNVWHGLGFQLLGYPVTMAPPLLPLVSGFFSLFTDNLEWGTNFVYVVFGGTMVAPFFGLARRIYGVRVARKASIFLAFYPGLLLSFYWGSMTEPLYTFLILTALFFLYRDMEACRPKDAILAGLFLGLIYLCRSEGILFFPVFLAFLVLRFASDRSLLRKKTVANLLTMTLVFTLVVAPYPLFIKRHAGGLSISGKTKLVLLAGAMPLEERERLLGKLNEEGTAFYDYAEMVKDKNVPEMILDNPKVLVGGSFLQIRNFFATLFSWKVFPMFLAPFAILGFFLGRRNKTDLRNETFLVTACLPFVVFLTFRIWPRYLLPMTPVLLLWTVRGIVCLEDRIQAFTRRTSSSKTPLHLLWRFLPSVILALALLTILVAKPIKARMFVQYPVEYKSAGEWMNANLPPDAMILTRKPEVAYYARRMMRPLPNEDLTRILGYARAHKVQYLVVDDFFIATRPQLRNLLGAGSMPPGLRLIHEAASPNGRKIRVFRILDGAASSLKGKGGDG